MARLFLLEVVVFKIRLEHYRETIASKDDISINVRFSDIMNVDISPEYFPVQGESPLAPVANQVIDLSMGKTYLFTHDPKEMITELKTFPLELMFRFNRKMAGTAIIPWKSEFSDMVKIFETIGVVKSVEYDGSVDISENVGKVGSVEIFVRLSCFGTSIETDFRMIPGTDEFVFMNPRTMATFKCMSFDPRLDMATPVSSVYQPVFNIPAHHPQVCASQVSWTELFGGATGVDNKLSVAPMAVDDEDFYIKMGKTNCKDMDASRCEFDMVSMVFRPPENKFFDFLNLVSAGVATNQEETLVTLTLDRQPNKKLGRPGVGDVESDASGAKAASVQAEEKKEVDDPLEMTAEKIARKLCKNKDCPAARKFKEFGIGPLATGPGLGTLYGNVEPPVSYGLSHTYGTLANYGPYGLFTRPKDPNQPFIPRKDSTESRQKTCPNDDAKYCCNEKLKLRGGCMGTHKFSVNCRLKRPMRLRLRGGGPKYHDSYHIEDLCLKRNPILDLFNQLLAAEKKVLESYRTQRCYLEAKARTVSSKGAVAQDTQNSPAEQRLRGGGPVDLDLYGPRSPFLECKPVMDQFDQILAAYKKAIGPCGEATCPYAQNAAEIGCKKFCEQKPVPEDTEDAQSVSCDSIPCGRESCPYKENKNSFPAGCGSPKCAYTKYKLGLVDDDAALELQFLPPAISGKCGHPKCGYPHKPDLPPIHWDCPDPLPKGNCKNPQCPFLPPDLKALKCPGAPRKGPCGSTDCPYALPPPCGRPSCPFRQTPCPFLEQQRDDPENASCFSGSDEGDVCENPECPFTKKGDDESACIEDPQIKGEFTQCANPDCPFARDRKTKEKKKKKPKKVAKGCGVPDKSPAGPCENPNCPFAPTVPQPKGKKKKPKKCVEDDQLDENEDEICANPECPYASGKSSSESDAEETCEVDSTTEAAVSFCGDPSCPYAQPLASCGIPNCPYEPNRPCDGPPKRNSSSRKGSAAGKDGTCRKDPLNIGDSSCRKDNSSGRKIGSNSKQGKEDLVQVETETTIICEEVPGLKEPKQKNARKKKGRGRFVYSTGDRYPGVKIGHKECVTPHFNVPPGMGWLWNVHTPVLRLKPRRGWKPGAIVRTIANRIRAHRQMKGLGILNVPKFRKDKKGSGSDDDVNVFPKPTLHIQKKDGSYWITMNPLKDPKTLAENEDPYMECTPMQFRITKKKQANEGGNDSKTCCCENEDLSSSSDSELDIEFTPPAGIIHPDRFKKKKNVVHCDTQYEPADFEVKKENPSKDKSVGGKSVGGKRGKEAGDKKGDKDNGTGEGGKGAKGGKEKKKK